MNKVTARSTAANLFGGSNSGLRQVYATAYFPLGHSKRRVYRQVVFDPQLSRASGGCCMYWIINKASECRKFSTECEVTRWLLNTHLKLQDSRLLLLLDSCSDRRRVSVSDSIAPKQTDNTTIYISESLSQQCLGPCRFKFYICVMKGSYYMADGPIDREILGVWSLVCTSSAESAFVD